jgi:hypothetical protein
MEATCSSETSVDFQRTTRRHIPEDTTLHNPLLITCIHAGFLIVVFFDPYDGGDMFLETSVDFHRTTRRYIPEDRVLKSYRRPPVWRFWLPSLPENIIEGKIWTFIV